MASRPLGTTAGTYQYEPLGYEEVGQIRVLVIDKGEFDTPISASLQVTALSLGSSLSATPLLEWDAVSYAWEGQDASECILVDGRPLRVTKNVLNVIRDLRHPERKRSLWIDAVCINQTDMQEKSHQIQQMRQIYQGANAVIIWLRPEGDEDRAQPVLVAIRWLNKIMLQGVNPQFYCAKSLVDCFTQENPHVPWKAPFHRIIHRSWFRRIWVVQEAVLARNLIIQLGSVRIPWDSFSSATLKFLSPLNADLALTESAEGCYVLCRKESYSHETLLGLSMINLIDELRAWIHNSDAPIAPSELVHMCKDLLASVPSDKIFAVTGLFGLKKSLSPATNFSTNAVASLFGLKSLSSTTSFTINYLVPYPEAYKAFTVWCIQQERNLDVLAQQTNENGYSNSYLKRPSNLRLPSWVTDWSDTYSLGFNTTEAVPFTARAAQSYANRCRNPPIYKRQGDILTLKGYVVDTGTDLDLDLGFGNDNESMENDNESMLKWQQAIPDDKKANLILFGEKRPTLKKLELLREKTLKNEAVSSHLWRDGDMKASKIQRSPGYRSAMLTARGCLAIAFRYMNYGGSTKICALYGGRSLFILQLVGGVPGRPLYRLVCGDCFIDGFGDGQGIEVARKLGLQEEKFSIV